MIRILFSYYRSLNYGAIGTILGHEMTHSLDSFGKVPSLKILYKKKNYFGIMHIVLY